MNWSPGSFLVVFGGIALGCNGAVSSQPVDSGPSPDATSFDGAMDASGADVTSSDVLAAEAAVLSDATAASDGSTTDERDAQGGDEGEEVVEDGAADVAVDVESPPPTLTVGNGLVPDPTCSGMPADTFVPDAEAKCFLIEADAGPNEVACVSTGGIDAGDIGLAACTLGAVGAPCPTSFSRRHGAYCCDPFPTQSGSMRCGRVSGYHGLALVPSEQLLDSDGDGVANLFDNCPYAPNFFQDDVDLDLIGDVCDDCPYTYDPAQASLTDGGIGNACSCDRSGVVLGPNGCPCEDGGAGSSIDAGDVCGLVLSADGGLVPFP